MIPQILGSIIQMKRAESLMKGQVYVDTWPDPEVVLFVNDLTKKHFVSSISK